MMTINQRNQSVVSHQGWVVEFYPFAEPDPLNSGNSTATMPPIGVGTSSSVDIPTLTKKLKDLGVYNGSDSIYVQKGLVRLNISRTKRSPENPMDMTFVGPTNVPLAVGTWVVASTLAEGKQLIRFVGQIHTVSVDYVVQPNHLISQVTNISARSWSSMLSMPVKFDMYAIQQGAAKDNSGVAAQVQSLVGGSFNVESLIKIISDNFNAFEFAHLLLKLIGCLNASDQTDKVKALGVESFPDVALTMPSVPIALLKRLGFDNLDQKNPFQPSSGDGLVSVITGILTGGFNNNGDWNGIFQKNTFASTIQSLKELAGPASIAAYKSMHNKEPKIRPVAAGAAGLVGVGDSSAWDLLTRYTDPALHEVVADILYEDLGKNNIVARPVIFVRDRPFLLKTIIKNKLRYGIGASKSLIEGNWSYFDDLPRVRISSAHILSVRARNTLYNSPNLIRFNFRSPGGAQKTDKTLSSLDPTRLPDHMARWGGQEHFIESQFYPLIPDGKIADVSMEDWSKTVKGVCTAWNSFNYKMMDMNISMKDDGAAITVGLNVQFNFGKSDYIGHVEGININFNVLPNGIEETNVALTLSRVVVAGTKGLEFAPVGSIGNLPDVAPPEPEEPFGFSTDANILSQIAETV